MAKAHDLARGLKDNFDAIAKLRDRSKEIQRLLTLGPTVIRDEVRLADELKSVFRTIRALEKERRDRLYK